MKKECLPPKNIDQSARFPHIIHFLIKRWHVLWKSIVVLCLVLVMVLMFVTCTPPPNKKINAGSFTFDPAKCEKHYGYSQKILNEQEMLEDYAELIYRIITGEENPDEKVQQVALDPEQGVWEVLFWDPYIGLSPGGNFILYISQKTGEVLGYGVTE